MERWQDERKRARFVTIILVCALMVSLGACLLYRRRAMKAEHRALVLFDHETLELAHNPNVADNRYLEVCDPISDHMWWTN